MADLKAAKASNSGRLPFSLARHLKCNPILLTAPPTLLVVMIGFVFIKGLPFWVGFGVAVVSAVLVIPYAAESTKAKLKMAIAVQPWS